MFYRIKDGRLYDFADYKYVDDCKELENYTLEQIRNNPDLVCVKENELIPKPDCEELVKEREKERIKYLSMTKLDFFKYVLTPLGITFAQLTETLNANEDLKAVWELCSRVYRGDETLNQWIKTIGMADDELDEIFKERGS